MTAHPMATFALEGRTAVVTGGAGLLGSEFCRTMAGAGAKVAVAERNLRAAQALAEEIVQAGAKARAIETDVTQPNSLASLVDHVVREFGSLDILVNCAAVDPKFDVEEAGRHSSGFEDYPLAAWRESLEVNLTGAFLACQAVSRPMLAQGKGVIINIGSTYGLVAPDQRIYQSPDHSPKFKPADYAVSKAGILGLTRYLASYFAGRGIRVNSLTPGGVLAGHDSDFVARYSERTMLGRMAQREEMNGALLFLATDASSYMTGANLVVDGGWTAW